MRRSLDPRACLVLVISAIVLTACGPPPPGTAAEVDGTRITMHQLEDAATGYCVLVDDASAPLASIRSQALSLLLLREAAETEVERQNLDLDPADLQVTGSQRAQIEELAGDAVDEALEVLEANLYVQAVAERLADAQDGASAQDAGIAALSDALRELDVEVDPRFSLAIDEASAAATSLATGETAAREALLPTQTCG